MSFRFPATIFVDQNTEQEQMKHICGELVEAITASNDEDFIMECYDAIHSIETLIRMRLKTNPEIDVIEMEGRVFYKNRIRGYYNEKW